MPPSQGSAWIGEVAGDSKEGTMAAHGKCENPCRLPLATCLGGLAGAGVEIGSKYEVRAVGRRGTKRECEKEDYGSYSSSAITLSQRAIRKPGPA
jgi:hypothetical protein